MKSRKKYSTAEIVMLVFCVIGCSLLVAQRFIDTEVDLFPIALGFNGIGLMAFLYSKK